MRAATEVALVVCWNLFLVLPLGGVMVHLARLHGISPAARLGLVAAAGYAAAALLALLLGTIDSLGIYPYCSGLALGLWWLIAGRPTHRQGLVLIGQLVRSPVPWVLLILVSLSLVAVAPLMNPVRRVGPQRSVSYAYIDAYRQVTYVQALSRKLPLAELPNLAGERPILYPDLHYSYLGMLTRLTGARAGDIYFRHGVILLVTLLVLLAYALGRELTGWRIGGYVGAALQFLVAFPNPYDLNVTLKPESIGAYIPTFYQIHFYTPRHNHHNGAGYVLVLAVLLCLLISLRQRQGRAPIAALNLAGVFVAALGRFRPQFALVIAPLFVLVILIEAVRRRNWRYLTALTLFAIVGGGLVAEALTGEYERRSANLVFRYGVFGDSLLDRWYLPARLQPFVANLAAVVRGPAAVAVLVIFRIVGVNVLALIAFRGVWLARLRQWPSLVEGLCLAGSAGAFLVAVLVQHRATTGNVGFQVLTLCHLFALVLAIHPVSQVISILSRGLASRFAAAAAGGLVLMGLTVVAHRAAEAAMHDQAHRAYELTDADRRAYHWIRTMTSQDAVVAAHPDHRVNPAGETVAQTDFVTAMTERSMFVARISSSRPAAGEARAAQVRRLFAARSEDEVCTILSGLRIHYILEFSDWPLAVTRARCLERTFAGAPHVYRVVRPL